MTGNKYSGVDVFITVGGKLFTREDLGIFQVNIVDSDEGDNEVELHCMDNDFNIADSALFRVGSVMSIKWGYTTTGEFSTERTGYVIMKPATSYGKDGTISVIKAKTKSATLASRRPQKTYGKTTVKTIVTEIAKRNSLKLELEGGNENLDGFSQANWSDRQVLRVLADRFGYQVSFSSETITFTPRKYGDTPKLSLVFSRGEEGNVISGHLNIDSHSSLGAASGASITSFDPKKKQASVEKAETPKQELAVFAVDGASWMTKSGGDAKTDPSIPGTSSPIGSISGVLNATKGLTNNWATPQTPTSGLSDAIPEDVRALLSTPDTIAGNSLAHATSLNLRHQKKQAELNLDTVGIPQAHARMIVEVSGLSKRDSGLYYVAKVHHKIKFKGGYECTFDLNRHGTNAGGGPKVSAPVNRQKANDGANGVKKVEVSAISGQTAIR